MGNLVFQAALGGQVAVSGPNTASSYTINVPTVNGTFVTTGDTGTVTTTMLASTTGSGAVVLATSPTLVTPALGTPSSVTLTNATGLPISTGLSGLTTNGVAYATSTSALATGSALTFNGTNLVTSTGASSTAVQLQNNTAQMQIVVPTSGGSNIQFYKDNSPTYVGAIGTYNPLNNTAQSAIIFSDYQGSWVERMRLTSAGYLGIGTSTTYANVQIAGATNATVLKVSATDQASGMLSLGDGGSSSNNVGVYRGQPHALSNGNWLNLGGYDGIAFTTGNNALGSQTEAMRIDTSGNLGLGVTPSTWSTGGGKTLQLTAGALTAYSTSNMQMVQNMYFNGGWIYSTSNYATIYNQSAGQHTWYNAPSGTAGNSVSLTQAMTLDNGGNLLVGTTSPVNSTNSFSKPAGYYGLTVNNSTSSSGGSCVFAYYSAASPNNTTDYFFNGTDQTTSRVQLRSNGGIANYTANNVVFSDLTIKKNIVPAKNYLSILNQIPVVTYLFNDQTDDELNLGVIAQDVQKVAPELVTTIDMGTKEKPNIKLGVYDSDLMFAMLKSIQELSAKVTALEAKLGV